MYYPCTFCTCAKHKSAVVNHRRRPLPPQSQLYPSQMYYPCTFCTCAKYKSAVFTAGVLAAFPPMALSCSPLSCLPACLPACRPQSSGKPFTSSKVRTNIPMYIAARLRQLETRRRPPHHASPSRERAAPLLRPQESEQQIADVGVGVGPHHLRLSRETVLVDMSVCCGQIY